MLLVVNCRCEGCPGQTSLQFRSFSRTVALECGVDGLTEAKDKAAANDLFDRLAELFVTRKGELDSRRATLP
jgi:hypothetical protein